MTRLAISGNQQPSPLDERVIKMEKWLNSKYCRKVRKWTNGKRPVRALQNIFKTSNLIYEWNSEVIQNYIPANAHIIYNDILWIIKHEKYCSKYPKIDAEMSRFWPNWYIHRIGVCKAFIDNGQPITHQTCMT